MSRESFRNMQTVVWFAKECRRAACRQLAKPCLIDFRASYRPRTRDHSSASGASASPNNLDELILTRSRGSLVTALYCAPAQPDSTAHSTAATAHLQILAINRNSFGSKLPSSITH